MGRLFGTDGARGIANTELTCELAMNIGKAAAMVLTDNSNKHPKILIGKDTRLSSNMLEGALIAGLCSVGADVVSLGFIATPAVAFLVGKYKADAGIMISASHNPCEFNGIKIFSGDGYKLPDALEEQIESIVLDEKEAYATPTGGEIGHYSVAENAHKDYIEHVKSSVPFALDGMNIALDCANGSASTTAERLFTELGAKVTMLHDSPNGTNINAECGSTHMESLMEYVRTHDDIQAGVAFDGDADRCLAVDSEGNLVDGDYIMAIVALDMKSRGKLKKNTVVGTIMTNMGFIRMCKENNINFIATKVGDRYVLEEMLLEEYNFGGEQSGHLIMLDFASTGDGQLTAAQLLSILKRREAKLDSLATLMTRYPQTIENVKVTNEGKLKFYTDNAIKEITEKYKKELGETGRVIVRVSGTEPLIRVMVECEDEEKLEPIAKNIASVIEERLG